MVRNVGVQGPDPTDTIRAFADLREQFAHLHAAFAVLLEGELRAHQRAGLPLSLNGPARQRLAVILVEHRLGIEAIHLRKSAVHEKEDDMLRARGMVNTALGPLGGLSGNSRLRARQRFSHHTRKGHHPEPAPNPAKRFTTGDRSGCFMCHRVSLELVRGSVPRAVASVGSTADTLMKLRSLPLAVLIQL